jgi:outer membrane murein-binding lipoprotein Lpp
MKRIVILGSLIVAGCVSQAPLTRQTQSGKAEATFDNVTPDELRNEIVLRCTQDGGEVQADQYSVTCGKRDDGNRALLAQVLVGNDYSQTPWQKMRITFAPVGSGVFVTADAWMEMTMGFGEVKRIPNTNNALRNELQAALEHAAENARNRKRLTQ